MFTTTKRIITDAVLPVIAFHSLAPPRAVNDMRAGLASGEIPASFSPTSC
jgi:hypothetical protein